MSGGAIFTLGLDQGGMGTRVAVKDLIDVKGAPTRGGSRAYAGALPALEDAACLAGTRAAGARIVGLTNLNELAYGVSGINPWTGTPENPLDRRLVPGGSSSGSAVAVARGLADVAFGTDTTGSIRVPAACCGVTGLKTTAGRIPLTGVRPLSPTCDSVGPLGRGVDDVVRGMRLLERGFRRQQPDVPRIGRVRLPTNPVIESAIDAALRKSELRAPEIELPDWSMASDMTRVVTRFEMWQANRELFESSPELLGDELRNGLAEARTITREMYDGAMAFRRAWLSKVRTLFRQVDFVAMPVLADFPPPLEHAAELWDSRMTNAWSFAGVPALAMPVPAKGKLPASLQLIGSWGSEGQLLGLGARVEAAVR